jgi:putative aldouronate transport system permease protein
MVTSRNSGDRLSMVVIVAALLLAMLVTLYPFIYVISMSISEQKYILTNSVWLLPKGFDFGAYKRIFDNPDVWRAYGNTLFYVFFGAAIAVVMTILGGYPLSRRQFSGRGVIMIMIVFTMFFGGGLIPSFLLIKHLGLYNTRWAIILPGAVGAFNIIITRTFFQSIPESLHESARIDGASDIGILLRIVLPLSKPIVAVLALYSVVSYWNGYFDALLYLPNKKLHPLALYLVNVVVRDQEEMTEGLTGALDRHLMAVQLKYALIVFATFPVIVTYPFVQKHFVKGALIGSLKE